ncbi:hypothetical protein GBA52_014249 [Prunus armeniaca]|nr:hypothetical protein GBA52_014249 [Prunus armeniaca]
MGIAKLLGMLLVIEIMSGFSSGAHGLSMGYYIMSCPMAEFIVRNSVIRALQADPTLFLIFF